MRTMIILFLCLFAVGCASRQKVKAERKPKAETQAQTVNVTDVAEAQRFESVAVGDSIVVISEDTKAPAMQQSANNTEEPEEEPAEDPFGFQWLKRLKKSIYTLGADLFE